MRKTLFLLFVALSFSFCKNKKPQKASIAAPSKSSTSSSQNTTPLIAPTDSFIKKYTGKIGKDNIDLVLINWANGNLGGYFFYKKQKNDNRKIELEGVLNLNETFILDGYVGDDFIGKFEGSLAELSTINGRWSNADSSLSMVYTLKEIPNMDKSGWTNTWYRNSAHSPGMLIMGNVTHQTIDFGLEVFNNGHNGLLEGTAKLNGGIAIFNHPVFDETEPCNLIFQKRNNQIRITQKSSNWACGFGMKANANGKYDNQLLPEKLELSYGKDNSIFTNKEQHDIFAKMVGKDYESFAFNMQDIFPLEKDPRDDFDAVVFEGRVTGLVTTNEAIVMRNDKNMFWAAVIVFDEMEDQFKVKYFTNDESRKNKIPYTIQEWKVDL